MSRLEKRSLNLAGHRTSVALEPEFWAALQQLADRQNRSLSQLIESTDAERSAGQALTSALRITALRSR